MAHSVDTAPVYWTRCNVRLPGPVSL